MIKHHSDMKTALIEHMRDGSGTVEALKLLEGDEFCPNFRLFNVMTLKKGCSIGPHCHNNETEYYYILSGCGIVSENDGEKKVGAGDLVITGGGASHAIRCEGEDDLVFIAAIITE